MEIMTFTILLLIKVIKEKIILFHLLLWKLLRSIFIRIIIHIQINDYFFELLKTLYYILLKNSHKYFIIIILFFYKVIIIYII